MSEIPVRVATKALPVKKADDELQIVWSEVYVPDWPDTHGAMMTATEIRKLAYGFMALGRTRRVNLGHNCEHPADEVCGCGAGAYVVESFVAREDDPVFVPGSWVAGVHVPDPEVWRQIKSGEINGFSMEAVVHMRKSVIEIDLPDSGEVTGLTGLANPGSSHSHTYRVRFSEDGQFVGGETISTSVGPAHVHRIRSLTSTEKVGDHSHRFSVLDAIGSPDRVVA